jgi:hypothetical protein
VEAPALLALFFGALLLPVVLIPYVGWSNRRGVTGPGHALISAAGVVYFAALWVLTIFPPPDSDLLEHVAIGVAAFIPFGALVRYLFGARVVTTVAIGVAVSLAIETTQVTGASTSSICSRTRSGRSLVARLPRYSRGCRDSTATIRTNPPGSRPVGGWSRAQSMP